MRSVRRAGTTDTVEVAVDVTTEIYVFLHRPIISCADTGAALGFLTTAREGKGRGGDEDGEKECEVDGFGHVYFRRVGSRQNLIEKVNIVDCSLELDAHRFGPRSSVL